MLTQRNIVNVPHQIVPNDFLSLGMLMAVRSGGIDLSVGSALAFCGLLATGLQEQRHFSAAIAIAIAIAMGPTVGWINGWLIARFDLQPFILFALTVPVVWFYLNHTVSGRAAFALGVNKEAVRLASVNVGKQLILDCVGCGMLAAIAGVVLASRLGITQPSVGFGYELDAIAAVVICGALLGSGGRAGGVLGGIMALAVVDKVLNLFYVDSYLQQFLKGRISAHMGAAALLGSLPSAEWLRADRCDDADWCKDALSETGTKPCITGRKSRGRPIKHDKRRYKSKILFGRVKNWRRFAIRYD